MFAHSEIFGVSGPYRVIPGSLCCSLPSIVYFVLSGEGVLFNENGKVEKEHNNKRAYPAKRKQTQF